MYELFGMFSEEDPITVHNVMLNLIKAEYELYNTVGRVVLNVRGCDLDTWLEEMDSNITIPDKLMLYALSRAYIRHTFVLCRDRIWSTLEITESMDEIAIFNACHIHLAYVDSSVYVELKPKPFSGNIPDPIIIELEGQALMHVRGHGRPRQKPLNLVKKKTASKTLPSVQAPMDNTNEPNTDVNQVPIPILPGVNVDPISVPIIPTGPTIFPEQELVVQVSADSSHLELPPVTAQTVSLPSDDFSTAEKCELEAAVQNRLNEQQNGVNSTTQETNEQSDAVSNSNTQLVPISWEVGTRLVYVTFDQIQSEIMEMEEYLARYKNKDVSQNYQEKENNKGSKELDFFSAAGGTNVKGHNEDIDTDSTESYDVPLITNNIKQQVGELFKQSARSNKCFVPVEKLTDDIIYVHQPSRRTPLLIPIQA